MNLNELRSDLKARASVERAKASLWFFKTGKGEYGEGDKFLGVNVPDQRRLARKFNDLSLRDVAKLVLSSFHEERLTGLFILVGQFEKGDAVLRKKIYDFYFEHLRGVNNWDLVDSSVPYIVGRWLLDKPRERVVLDRLAKSDDLWKRRIAIVATQAFMRYRSDFMGGLWYENTLKIAEMLLGDKHDLIHKAVGWMLREVGKVDQTVLEKFLKKYYKTMPRTMLRYAIERFSKEERAFYLGKSFLEDSAAI